MAISITIQKYLTDHQIPYTTLPHTRTASSSATAEAAHVPGARIVKAVIVRSGDQYKMALLPASHHLRLNELQDLLAQRVKMATEEQISSLLADCDVGAIPALGMAYGLDVVVDDSLTQAGDLFFEGGDHSTLVHLDAKEFNSLVSDAPHGHFSRHDDSPEARSGFRFSHS